MSDVSSTAGRGERAPWPASDEVRSEPRVEEPAAPAAVPPRTLGAQLVAALASMRLAVVLLVILALLTWLGTLAQVDRGLWDVQREYFESWFVIARLPLSFWGHAITNGAGETFALKIPLPGAYPVMALLFVNLMVGGFVRLRWRWRNAGVLITHVGIAFLLVAGFVKLEFSYSGHLALYEAPTGGGDGSDRLYESSAFVSFHDYELALLRDLGDTVEERTVPESVLVGARDGVVALSAEGLPFTVSVHHWLDNCRPSGKGPMVQALTPVVDGVFLREQAIAKEREANIAGCYVTVTTRTGERLESPLLGADMRPFSRTRLPFTFSVEGQRYALDLRRVVYDLPFEVRLDRFSKLDHPGTMMARDFRSFVTVREERGERQQQIYMNNPLRKDGFVLYQTNWGPQQGGGPPFYSVFEVSSNPSDMWPAIACGVIALGLLWHFLAKLWRFLNSVSREGLMS